MMENKSGHEPLHDKIQVFIEELNGFAQTAEQTLATIEQDMEGNKHLFSVFSEKMFTIRGTAQQLQIPNIAHIAGLGEEIALKGVNAANRSQIRKCIGSLWDALTTVKYLLQHQGSENTEEQSILINRLEYTLNAFGGARPTVNEDEIEELLKKAKPDA